MCWKCVRISIGEAAIALPLGRLGPRPGAGRLLRSRRRRRALGSVAARAHGIWQSQGERR
eukprot:1314152-Pleurochrysis_carterae.AAC.1